MRREYYALRHSDILTDVYRGARNRKQRRTLSRRVLRRKARRELARQGE